MGGLKLYAGWKNELESACKPGTRKAGVALLSEVRSKWAVASNSVKVISRVQESSYLIRVGSTRRSHLYSHLLEFGGARHTAWAPTQNAASAQGLRIKWKSD